MNVREPSLRRGVRRLPSIGLEKKPLRQASDGDAEGAGSGGVTGRKKTVIPEFGGAPQRTPEGCCNGAKSLKTNEKAALVQFLGRPLVLGPRSPSGRVNPPQEGRKAGIGPQNKSVANRRSRARTASLREANASSVSPRAACAAAKYTGDTFSPSNTRSSSASNRHSQYPSAPSERVRRAVDRFGNPPRAPPTSFSCGEAARTRRRTRKGARGPPTSRRAPAARRPRRISSVRPAALSRWAATMRAGSIEAMRRFAQPATAARSCRPSIALENRCGVGLNSGAQYEVRIHRDDGEGASGGRPATLSGGDLRTI